MTPGAPTISADAPPARNPAINPSAAGLSKGRMAAPTPAGSGGKQPTATSTATSGEVTKAQARRWLRHYGYAGIVNLHVDQNGHWEAQATRNGRRVKVALDDRGTATEQK